MIENHTYNVKMPTDWTLINFAKSYKKISLTGIKIKQKDYQPVGKFPVVDQGQELIGGYFSNDELIVPEEPPFVIFGDHTKVKKYINFKFIAGADGVKVLKPYACFNPKLFYYFIHCIKLPDKGYARHFQFLEKAEIPLPPLPEQHAIVSKIEQLFSELDKGIESLKTAQQQLKVYRQSVLKSAFEGKLTNDNVIEGELPEGWRMGTIKDVASKITDGEHFRPKTISSGIPFLSAKDVRDDGVSFEDPLYVSEETAKKALLRCNPQSGDILIVSRGATVGRMCIVKTDEIFCLLGSVILIKVKEELSSQFLTYILKSPQINQMLISVSGATAQQAIYLRDIKNIEIPIPTRKEQHQIVQEIECRLSECDNMEATITASLQQAEALRQSILKKAFEGKLLNERELEAVRQDPTWEPAERLLERIWEEKAKHQSKESGRKRKVKV